MRNLTVPFHLPETQASVSRPTLHGLPDEDLKGASGPRVDLVVHHVLQSLVVSGPQEDLGVDLPAGVAVIHDLVASQLVAVLLEQGRDFLYIYRIVERGGVADFALVGRHLALDALDQVTNRHTRRDSVGVDYDVGGYSFAAEDHVLESEMWS